MKPSSCFMRCSSFFSRLAPPYFHLSRLLMRSVRVTHFSKTDQSVRAFKERETYWICTHNHACFLKCVYPQIVRKHEDMGIHRHTCIKSVTHLYTNTADIKATESLTQQDDHRPRSISFDSLTAYSVFCVAEEAYGVWLLPSTLLLLLH